VLSHHKVALKYCVGNGCGKGWCDSRMDQGIDCVRAKKLQKQGHGQASSAKQRVLVGLPRFKIDEWMCRTARLTRRADSLRSFYT